MVINKTTIIMPIFNKISMALKNIQNIIDSGFDGEIIIINDNPNDPNSAQLSYTTKNYKKIKLISNSKNIGYTKSINIGLKKAITDYVLIINSDAFITNNSILILEKQILSSPQLSGISPISDNAGNIKLLSLTHDWESLSSSNLIEITDLITKQIKLAVGPGIHIQPSINGFCSIWRLNDIRNLGYFDETNFPIGYGEEEDLCIRLENTGKLVGLSTSSFVPHIRTSSFTEDQKEYLKDLGNESLIRKWGMDRVSKLHIYYVNSPIHTALKIFL